MIPDIPEPPGFRTILGDLARHPGTQRVGAVSAVAALTAGVAFLINVVMSRALGPTGRGEVVLSLQISYVLWPALALGVDRWLLRPDTELPPRAASLIHIPLLSAIACGVLLVVTRSPAFALAAPVALFAAVIAVVRSRGYRSGSLHSFVWLSVADNAVILVGALLLSLTRSNDAAAWLIPYAIPGLALGFVVLVLAMRNRGTADASLSLVRKSAPLAVGAVAAMVALRADRLMLAVTSGTTALGLYVAAATTLEFAAVVSAAWSDWLVSSSQRTPSRASSLVWIAVRTSPVLLVIAGLGLLVRFAVLPLLGTGFEPATALILPLCLAQVAFALARVTNSLNLAGSHPRSFAVSDTVQGAISLPVYWFMTARYEALGAAYGSAVVYAVGAVVAWAVFFRQGGGGVADDRTATQQIA